jgi:hypothetical protein
MSRAPRLLGAAVVLLSLAALAAGNEATYDLRGPAPKKGQKITQKGTFKLTDGKNTTDDGTESTTLDISQSGAGDEEEEVLAVEGRKVTKARLKIGKAYSEVTVTVGGKEQVAKETRALSGETVVMEKVKGKWKKELAGGGKPTEKQKQELEKIEPPADEGLTYPDKKVAKGHKWDVKPEHAARLLGGDLTGVTGKATGHFRAVEKVSGESCAVIDFEMDLKGTPASGDKTTTLSFKGKSTVHRSLKSGVDLKLKTEGSMRMRSKFEEGGKTVETDLRGKLTWVRTASVK